MGTMSAQYHLLHHVLGQQQLPERPYLKGHQQVPLVALCGFPPPWDGVEPLDGTGDRNSVVLGKIVKALL